MPRAHALDFPLIAWRAGVLDAHHPAMESAPRPSRHKRPIRQSKRQHDDRGDGLTDVAARSGSLWASRSSVSPALSSMRLRSRPDGFPVSPARDRFEISIEPYEDCARSLRRSIRHAPAPGRSRRRNWPSSEALIDESFENARVRLIGGQAQGKIDRCEGGDHQRRHGTFARAGHQFGHGLRRPRTRGARL